MRPYRKADVVKIYSDIMQYAHKKFEKGQHCNALTAIIASCHWAYNLNMFYADDDAEQLVKEIADKNLNKIAIPTPNKNRCILIDSFLLDNRGLSQQYLRAFMANDMEVLVIYTTAGGLIGEDTLLEIKSYKKARLLTFKRGISFFEETQQIIDSIGSFSPAHIFLHLTPWDVVALMACHAVKGAKIYQINLTDHAYWMGARFIDYNLEFRPYGYTVSLEKRGLKADQLLALPYYPIVPISGEFEGLPQLPSNSVIIFTGGDIYKMLGKEDIFFRMMECILSIAPNVYILVAGFKSSSIFSEKVSKIKGGERVLQIGVRHDIDAVFENSDIFLGTYPTAGALMPQYAAMHAKPIIAYRDSDDMEGAIEEIVYSQGVFQSFISLDSMTDYAKKLINSIDFRVDEGRKLQKNMIVEEQFNKDFTETINTHHPILEWNKDVINYDAFFERYLELENLQFSATKTVVVGLKLATFFAIKTCRKNMLWQFIKVSCSKIARMMRLVV